MAASHEIEEGFRLLPAFDRQELLPCITVEASTGEVLMLAYMNREALERTIATKKATYWSRSRGKFWVKGEQSGHFQHVEELRVDCDQDAILLKVRTEGGAACHVGYRSCFFRKLKDGSEGELELAIAEKAFDPAKVYGPGH
ncbi:MAG: phosphoribosyl-AMP cyclohydrolase [Verrucomicrobium sp.]|nr:phosphoribosyl-AMP cyclohydrolase [Verrucomicrobium sp.]